MELLEKLLISVKKTIFDEELQQICQESDYDLFHTEVERLVESGVLVPVKSSKTNGRLPPLFNRSIADQSIQNRPEKVCADHLFNYQVDYGKKKSMMSSRENNQLSS